MKIDMKIFLTTLLIIKIIMPLPASGIDMNEPVQFTDPNFKLVVMESLLENKRLELGDHQKLAEKILKRSVDLEEEGFSLKPEIYDYLVSYPLTKTDLATVKEIIFDGGHQIYSYPFHFWDGETEDFDINSLRDIALCPNVEYIGIASMLNDGDLNSLSELKKLRVIELSYTPNFYNLEVLLKLPNLKEFEYFSDTIDAKYDGVLRRLKGNGVKIRVN